MNYIKGNLFDYATSGCIVHSCNRQGAMRSGFAKEFRERFPSAFNGYKIDIRNGMCLGGVSIYSVDDLILCSLIGQEKYGYDGRKYTSYDAIDMGLRNIFSEFRNQPVHIPKIGSDRGGGDWLVIEQIILSTAKKVGYNHENITVYWI